MSDATSYRHTGLCVGSWQHCHRRYGASTVTCYQTCESSGQAIGSVASMPTTYSTLPSVSYQVGLALWKPVSKAEHFYVKTYYIDLPEMISRIPGRYFENDVLISIVDQL